MSRQYTLADGLIIDVCSKKELLREIKEYVEACDNYSFSDDTVYEILYTDGSFCYINECGVMTGEFHSNATNIASIIGSYHSSYSVAGKEHVIWEDVDTGDKYDLIDLKTLSAEKLENSLLTPSFY